jgi:hypothetical protein
MAGFRVRERNLTGSGHPARVRALAVTPELFDVLAVRPARGRRFTESDAQPGAPPVVVLTHRFWQSRFGGDPNVVGRSVELDGQPAQIVGIMPADSAFPDAETRLLIPLWLDPKGGFGEFGTSAVARLAPGATFEAARHEIETLQGGLTERFGVPRALLDMWRWSVTVERLRDHDVGDLSRLLWILSGSVALVLLIAGANVANLFLVRAESRRRELAVRSALGASSLRLAWAFLAESIVLALVGGVWALLMATVGTPLVRVARSHRLPAPPRGACGRNRPCVCRNTELNSGRRARPPADGPIASPSV